MKGSLDDISLMPWQSTIITWEGWITLILFLALIPMLFLRSSNKRAANKIHTLFGVIFGAFLLAMGISMATMVSFIVDIELGWKLSLLAFISVALGGTSLIAMLYGAITDMSMQRFLIWLFLSILSLALLINLLTMSAQKVTGQ